MGGLVGLMWIVVVGGALLLGLGELGRSVPVLDTINHFLPHIAIIMGVFAVAALPIGRWVIVAVGAAGAAWATTRVMADGVCTTAADGGAPLTVLTFNILGGNLDLRAVEARIRAVDADIVVLVEYTPVHTPVGFALEDVYPSQVDCAQERGCRMALFAKQPFLDAGTAGREQHSPPIVRARFAADGGRPAFTVAGTHVLRPFDGGDWQQQDLRDVAAALNGMEGPLVVAGDFNATPWSIALTDFRAAAGLCGAPGYRPSWPVWLGSLGLPIDHVLVSEGLSIEAETVEPAGSDHLPVRAVLRFP